jgi:hypothetical protein
LLSKNILRKKCLKPGKKYRKIDTCQVPEKTSGVQWKKGCLPGGRKAWEQAGRKSAVCFYGFIYL